MSAPGMAVERPVATWVGSTHAAVLAAVAGVWIATIALLWGTFTDMWRVWGASGTFAHGYLILPIVLLLLWMRRDRWRKAEPAPGMTGFALIALAVLIWLAGSLLHLNVVMQFGAVGLLVAEAIAIVGTQTFRRFAFPILFLLLAVPAGEELVPWLMDFTAAFTVSALDAVGIPVYAEGRLIYIPSGNFAVEKACSGVRYLIASIVLGTLYAHLHYRTLWRRALFVALAAIVPVAANGVRAFTIVLLAHVSDNRIAVGIDHLIYGWFFFGVVMLLVVWIGRTFSEPARAKERGQGGAGDSAQGVRAAPEPEETREPSLHRTGAAKPGRVSPWLAAFLSLIPVAAGVAGAAVLDNNVRQGEQQLAPVPGVPAPMAGWAGPLTISADWQPQFAGPSREVRAAYLRGTTNIDVAVMAYVSERPGAELVNSENRLFDEERWRWLGERTIDVTLADGSLLPMREVLVRSGVTTRTIWLALAVSGRPVLGSLQAKLARARDLLSGGPGAGTAVAFSARSSADRSLPEADLREFVVKYYAPLLACLAHNEVDGASREDRLRCVAVP